MLVRLSAKELTSLIMDEERLRAERHDRKLWKQRVTGLEDYGAVSGFGGGAEPSRRRKPQRSGSEDDLEYKLALEASKNQEEEDRRRRQQSSHGHETDDDLAKALKLSKEEEELRKKELEDSNTNTLFDFDSNSSQQQQAQPTGWNQGYQQQGAVDWFGNPLDQQQPQNTGFLNNAYAQTQPTGMQQQQQQTGFPNGFGYNNPYQQQPQQTGFDQAQYQQPQQTAMQPQQTAFNVNNPYAQQAIQPPPQQQQSQPQPLQSGSNNPWGQNSSGVDSVKPQPTGSNNPFASSFNRPQTSSAQRPPTLGTLQEQKTAQFQSFTNTPSPFSQPAPQQPSNPFPSQPQPMQQPQLQQQTGKPVDPHHANLNALLASGDGQDTFGNTGDLRIPAQHTAPGTFVNSAGTGRTGLASQQTGSNPFMHNQFTGVAPQGGLQPAQTGPAMGFGNSNPFGQNRQQGQGSNLIDI